MVTQLERQSLWLREKPRSRERRRSVVDGEGEGGGRGDGGVHGVLALKCDGIDLRRSAAVASRAAVAAGGPAAATCERDGENCERTRWRESAGVCGGVAKGGFRREEERRWLPRAPCGGVVPAAVRGRFSGRKKERGSLWAAERCSLCLHRYTRCPWRCWR